MIKQKLCLMVVVLAALAACGGGGGSGDDPVIGPVPVVRIAVSPTAPTLTVGNSMQLGAVLYDANNRVVTGRTIVWTSSDALTVAVNTSGMVSALKAGPARITATVGTVSGNTDILVNDPPPQAVDRVAVTSTTTVVEEGSVLDYTATAFDAQNNVINGRGVTWSIQDSSIATVSGGAVTGLRSGSTLVSARIDGKTGSANVTVEAHYPFELLYGRYVLGTDPEVYSLDIRDPAAVARRFNAAPPGLQQAAPSPDGQKLAYVVSGASSTSIYVANMDGSNPVPLFADGNYNDQPAWSPDGGRIAFRHRVLGSGADIWIVDASNGGNPQNLTAFHGATSQSSPSFSPVLQDGSVWVAYSHAQGGAAQIWAVRANGTDHRAVTTNPAVYDDQPSWSPDGMRIVFTRSGDAIFGDLYVVNASGGNGGVLMQLAGPLAFGQFAPAWSPDGQLIAFSSRHAGNVYQIYTVWHDGTRLAQRTFDDGDHDFPRWVMLGN
jgi:dipeptidyl aminopeptidase/acylaminoacyl peptidase